MVNGEINEIPIQLKNSEDLKNNLNIYKEGNFYQDKKLN